MFLRVVVVVVVVVVACIPDYPARFGQADGDFRR